MSRRGIGVAILAWALVCVSVTAAVTSERGRRSTQSGSSAVEASRLRAAQYDLLRELRRGLSESPILDVRLGRPPEPFDASEDVRGIPNAAWIFYKIRGVDHVDYKRGKWQALVVSGLLRDLGASRGLPPLVGQSFTIVWPDGSEEYDAANTIFDAAEEPATGVTDDELARRAREGARGRGAQVLRTRISRLLGRPAPEFTVRADDPAGFMRNRDDNVWAITAAISGEHERALAEGAFIEVRDAAGRFVTVSGYSARLRQGTGASSPGFPSAGGGGPLTSSRD